MFAVRYGEIIMKILGITGGSGTGKTTVSKIFEQYGMYRIDADIVAREIVAKGEKALSEIADTFGGKVINSDGTLNRKALAKIVFNSKEDLLKLNQITHKYVSARIDMMLKSCTSDWAIIDAAALIESGINKKCDKVLSVVADFDVRKKRITERDGIDEKSAEERIKAQHDKEFYTQNSDFVIENNKDEYNLKIEAEKVLKQLR